MKKLLLSGVLAIACWQAQAQETNTDILSSKRTLPSAKLVLYASPLHVTEENIGVSAGAELFMDKKGILSVVVPISYAFHTSSGSYSTMGYTYQTPYYPNVQSRIYNGKGMFYVYPGFKIYPNGANKKVSYAAGANVVLGIGSADKVTTQFRVDSSFSGGQIFYSQVPIDQRTDAVNHLKLGVIITNSLNLRPTQHLYMGIDFGIGYSYLDNWGGSNLGTDVMLQLGAKIGYVR